MLTPTTEWKALEVETWDLAPGWLSGPRLHSSHNVIVVLRGQLRYSGPTGETRADAPAAFFIPRATRHQLATENTPCRLAIFRIRLAAFGLNIQADAEAWELVMAIARHAHAHGPLLNLSPRGLSIVRRQVRRMQDLGDFTGHGRLARTKAAACEAIAAIADDLALPFHAPLRQTTSFQGIRSVITHLESNYASRIRVSELARQATLSRSQFHAVFHDYTGLSAVDYLTRVRIGVACRLLRDSSLGILDIALRSGFGSSSRFYEAFAQVTGDAPGRWRRSSPMVPPTKSTRGPGSLKLRKSGQGHARRRLRPVDKARIVGHNP